LFREFRIKFGLESTDIRDLYREASLKQNLYSLGKISQNPIFSSNVIKIIQNEQAPP